MLLNLWIPWALLPVLSAQAPSPRRASGRQHGCVSQEGGRLAGPPGPSPLTPCGSQKVMHTRKRHSELYHELNQKFHTFDRYRSQSSAKVRAPSLTALP